MKHRDRAKFRYGIGDDNPLFCEPAYDAGMRRDSVASLALRRVHVPAGSAVWLRGLEFELYVDYLTASTSGLRPMLKARSTMRAQSTASLQNDVP